MYKKALAEQVGRNTVELLGSRLYDNNSIDGRLFVVNKQIIYK